MLRHLAGVDAQLLEQFGPAEGGFARRCSCDHAEPLAFANIAQWMIGIVRRQGCQRSAHRMAAGGTEAGGQAQHRRLLGGIGQAQRLQAQAAMGQVPVLSTTSEVRSASSSRKAELRIRMP